MNKSTPKKANKTFVVCAFTSLGGLVGGIFILRDLESVVAAIILSILIWPAVVAGASNGKKWFKWFISIWFLITLFMLLLGRHAGVVESIFILFCFVGSGLFACLGLSWLTKHKTRVN